MADRATAITVKTALVYRSVVMETPLIGYRVISKRLDNGKDKMVRIEYILYGVIMAVLFGTGDADEFVKKFLGV